MCSLVVGRRRVRRRRSAVVRRFVVVVVSLCGFLVFHSSHTHWDNPTFTIIHFQRHNVRRTGAEIHWSNLELGGCTPVNNPPVYVYLCVFSASIISKQEVTVA